ncbi:MAG: hypothetical protein ACOYN4_04220 [Bacteroidales bacterium]
MVLQEILTYLAIVVATGFVLYNLFQTIFPAKTTGNQHGCSSGCNCDAKVMRKELLSKKLQKSPKHNLNFENQ